MQLVRSTPGNDIEVASKRTAKFRLPAGRDYLKLPHHVHAEDVSGNTGRIVIVGKSIHDETIREVPLAVDGVAPDQLIQLQR